MSVCWWSTGPFGPGCFGCSSIFEWFQCSRWSPACEVRLVYLCSHSGWSQLVSSGITIAGKYVALRSEFSSSYKASVKITVCDLPLQWTTRKYWLKCALIALFYLLWATQISGTMAKWQIFTMVIAFCTLKKLTWTRFQMHFRLQNILAFSNPRPRPDASIVIRWGITIWIRLVLQDLQMTWEVVLKLSMEVSSLCQTCTNAQKGVLSKKVNQVVRRSFSWANIITDFTNWKNMEKQKKPLTSLRRKTLFKVMQKAQQILSSQPGGCDVYLVCHEIL